MLVHARNNALEYARLLMPLLVCERCCARRVCWVCSNSPADLWSLAVCERFVTAQTTRNLFGLPCPSRLVCRVLMCVAGAVKCVSSSLLGWSVMCVCERCTTVQISRGPFGLCGPGLLCPVYEVGSTVCMICLASQLSAVSRCVGGAERCVWSV